MKKLLLSTLGLWGFKSLHQGEVVALKEADPRSLNYLKLDGRKPTFWTLP